MRSICENPPLTASRQFPDIEGWTGELVQELIYRLALAGRDRGVYLEVGSYQGKTLLSAAQAGCQCIGVEDYSQAGLGTQRPPDELREILRENVRMHRPVYSTVRLVERSCWDYFALGRVPPVSVYFYDGAHDEESQVRGLMEVRPFLRSGAIVLVDDAGADSVRRATERVLEQEPCYDLVNLIQDSDNARGYWNGLYCLEWLPERMTWGP